ncbi:EAL domain-containing protein [Bacillus sonorensis]|uniref:EAL domain-containing protein n=1 Tax=Bacillus sonorensis TaxID=119858 RepID=UPI00049639FB|nr:EAL domain-containing protein [Bacillus sonorensis]MEC1590208.1 EAL domain-containing protein [Bacillus sonorensis]
MTEVFGEYHAGLIVLSYITAVLAAYTALDLSERVVHTKGWKNKGWLLAGSLTMGLGIWSMHFIGMMSFQTEADMTYDPRLVILSIFVAFISSLLSFYVANGKNLPKLRLWAASFAMGSAIASMHFIGMESMDHIKIVYNPALYAASFAIAITASFAALKLSFVFAKKTGSFRMLFIKIGSALFMGGAISGMHYTGMAAASLHMTEGHRTDYTGIDAVQLGIGVVMITLFLQALLIFGAITDKRLLFQAEKVKDNEERFQSLINHNIDPIYVFSLEGRMLSANSAGYMFLKMMGVEYGLFSGLFRREDHEKLLGWFHQVKHELQALNRDTQITLFDNRFDLNLTMIPVCVKGRLDSIYVICKDMTKQREAERKIHRMAHYDALTDLPNRRYAVSHLKHVLHQQQKATAVLFLDLNRFKAFNDDLGHNIGDLLLIEAAKRLAECVPEQGFIARLGGDEFIIIIPADPDRQNIDRLSERLIQQFESAFYIKKHRLNTSVSIGIAISPTDGTDGEELIKKADIAMYAAKKQNQSKYQYFSPSIGMQYDPSLKKEAELQKAQTGRRFILRYAPQFSSSSKKMTGVEALVCLKASDGMIHGFSEAAALIADLEEWMIDEVCRQAKKWHDNGIPLTISVNLSSRHFDSEPFMSAFENSIKKLRLPSGLLEAEVAEAVLMKASPYTKRRLTSLQKLGVPICLDHFGSGGGSLHTLFDLPISKIKIDKSIIKGVHSGSKSEQMAGAIISFARHLSLDIAAEGVETAEQAEFLTANGCDVFQRNDSRLLSAEEAEKLIYDQSMHAGSIQM